MGNFTFFVQRKIVIDSVPKKITQVASASSSSTTFPPNPSPIQHFRKYQFLRNQISFQSKSNVSHSSTGVKSKIFRPKKEKISTVFNLEIRTGQLLLSLRMRIEFVHSRPHFLIISNGPFPASFSNYFRIFNNVQLTVNKSSL